MLGEKPIKDGSQFEEESFERNEQTGIKTDQTDGKIERTDQSEELANANSEIESGNNSPGADKLEPIIEEEKENAEMADPTPKEASQRLLSIFEGKEVVDDVPDKNVNSREGFEGGNLKRRKEEVSDREKEELVYLREAALAKAVLFITRQLSLFFFFSFFTARQLSKIRFASAMTNIHALWLSGMILCYKNELVGE